MPQVEDIRQAHPGSGLDVCQLPSCGIEIKTQCWRGTGACSDTHFKLQHGHGRVGEYLQQRGRELDEIANRERRATDDSERASIDEDLSSVRERPSGITGGAGRIFGSNSGGGVSDP